MTVVFALLILFACSSISFSADEESCILCHRHKNLSVADADGNVRSFFVDNEHFKDSVHRRVACRGCHTNITSIPHKASGKMVNCGITCHIQRGMSTGSYTHKKTYDEFMTSSHGNTNDDSPNCLYCHDKNLRRSERKKARIEVLAICAKCHRDDETMKRYGVIPDIVESYATSSHGRVFFLEQSSGPICTDCHSMHNITPKEVETSPIYKDKLFKTCAGQEASIDSRGCHSVSSPDFVESFSHKKDKESGAVTGLWLGGAINYLTLGIFYLFCIINILRIIRD